MNGDADLVVRARTVPALAPKISSILRRIPAPLALLALVLLAYAPILDDLVRLLRLNVLASSTGDTATHFLRMLHARDLYLPSGHHWGWEPYWFQGYVPFLLYPHLMYVALALVSVVLAADAERVFNAYTAAILVALPLVPALAVLRSRGLAEAALCAWWLAALSTFGAGLAAIFGVGLIAQHTGVVVFAVFVFDVVVAKRLDRAAIWLGLAALLHVHTALAAGFVWLVAGLVAYVEARERTPAVPGERTATLAAWCVSSALAVAIAAPTVVGLLHGRHNLGDSTGFAFRSSVLGQTVSGSLVAPAPILAAIAIVVAAALLPNAPRRRSVANGPARGSVSNAPGRRSVAIWSAASLSLFVVAFDRWSVGIDALDRILRTMLYLRTLPYAFLVAAMLALACWSTASTRVRRAAIALSVLGIVGIWGNASRYDARIGRALPAGSRWTADVASEYRTIVRSVAWDLRDGTATVVAQMPKPQAPMMVATVRWLRQPMLYGHGIELTDVRNNALVYNWRDQSCEEILRQIDRYAIGYLVGTDADYRAKLEGCLGRPPAAATTSWWMFSTGRRWASLGGQTTGFERNETWTSLEWRLRPSRVNESLELPMASTAPWIVEADGKAVSVTTTGDGMMRVAVPPHAQTLRMRYAGFAGEWASVAVAVFAFVLAALRSSRRRA